MGQPGANETFTSGDFGSVATQVRQLLRIGGDNCQELGLEGLAHGADQQNRLAIIAPSPV